MRSWRREMHCMLMSELGWLSNFSKGIKRPDYTRMGICSCVSSCSELSMLSISSSVWQNFKGSVGYFILNVMSVSYSQANCCRHALRVYRESCCSSSAFCIFIIDMEGLLGAERTGKYIVISLVVFIVGVIIGVVKLVTGSLLLGVLVLLGLLWWLLRQVGALVMYPGSFFMTRSDIEMRYSREIGSRMVHCFNALHALGQSVAARTYHPYQNHADFVMAIDRHVRAMLGMLGMFEASLSQRKSALLNNYRRLQHNLEAREGDYPCIFQLIAKPRLISSLQEKEAAFYKARFAEIAGIIGEMVDILKSYAPPTGAYELMRFRLKEENLYELRFGFYNWNVLYDYEISTVLSGDANIETAIIHSHQRRSQDSPPAAPSRRTVLFCNPNGVFIQFFGADNDYISNYLKQGYRVILWNYRGYGQSTGTPSISSSQQDALAVYHFYRAKGFEIEIVHGYSIGGAAAVGLMDRLGEQPQLPGDRVRVLIVDRSFSSIGEMSVQFGRALYNLTRLIFFADNMDLSRQFERVRCRKLLIWDYCDEVIPDKASVKNRIIKRRKGQNSKKRQHSEADRFSLSEEGVSDRQVEAQFQDAVRKLEWSVAAVLELRKDSDSSDKELNQMLERQSSGTTAGGMQGTSIEALVRMISRVDGGGIELFHNMGQLQEIRTRKPEYFLHICENYVLGLVCYGSYFPLRPIVHDHARIKAQTIQKLDLLVSQLAQKGSPSTYSSSPSPSVAQLQSNFAWIFQRLRQLVQQCFCEEWFALHGSLLPTNNGHNASLNRAEFEVLNEFIANQLRFGPNQDLPAQGELTEEQAII